MKVAFYKAEGSVYNRFIRTWDAGAYSHCELIYSDGLAASASYRDNRQVRAKHIEFDNENWDFIEICPSKEAYARQFLVETEGNGYDLIGQIRFLLSPLHGQRDKFWCSEWIAAALQMPDPWRYGPNGLYAALSYKAN